jgi:hypothetical protein
LDGGAKILPSQLPDLSATFGPTAQGFKDSYAPKNQHLPVNAKLDYGAVGDGTTDDTSSLQNFINYCVLNGREGFIPAGTYKITSRLNFSALPGWSIRGEHRGNTTIKQFTDNTAIFYLGSDTASYMHTWKISNLAFDYANTQSAANTSANPILFNTMAFEGDLRDCTFTKGSYAMRVASGVGCPWGVTFDNLIFQSPLTAGAMDWSLGVNAVPNNHFGRFFVDCANMVGPVFHLRGYNFVIDTVEFVRANLGPNLMTFAAGARVEIGTVKIENGIYAASRNLFDFQANCFAHIGHLNVGGSAMYFTAGTCKVVNLGAGSGKIDIGFIDFAATTTPTGAVYLIGAAATVNLGKYAVLNCTGLQDNGSTDHGNFITVRDQVNRRLSNDKGDADYTVTLGDANIIAYGTAFTAPRTITLPSTGVNLFNGLYYEIVINGAINGANSLTIKANTTTLRTQTTDRAVIGYTWRRHASAPSGWILTKYQTLP